LLEDYMGITWGFIGDWLQSLNNSHLLGFLINKINEYNVIEYFSKNQN